MPSLENRFENLRKDLETNYEGFNNLADENSGLFIYEPSKEREVIEEVNRLSRKLKKEYEVNKISLFDLLFEGLENITPEGREFIYEQENKDPKGLTEDAHDPLLEYISEKIVEYDERMDQGITLIYRCGALYPFLRIHSITAKLQGSLENPTMIFYPGEKEGQELRFLNSSSQKGDYRAKIYEA